METNQLENIDKAIYSLMDGKIVARRKNSLLYILIMLIGLFLLFVVAGYPSIKANPDLHSAILFFGFSAAVVGFTTALVRLLGKKNSPYYTVTREALHCSKEYFDAKYNSAIKASLQRGDIEGIASIPHCDSSSLMMVKYATSSGKIVIAQLQEFIPYTYVPATEAVVITK